MIDKKRLLVFVVFLLIFLSLTCNATAQLPDELNPETLKDNSVTQKVNDLKEFTEEKKWLYVGEKWKELLLKNKYISFWDSFFRKINFAFFFLLGENYDLSLIFFFTIVLWIFFFLSFFVIFRDFSTFSREVSMIISFAIAVISSHLGIYNKSAETLFKLIFFKEGIWMWVSLIVVIFSLLFVIAFLKFVAKKFSGHRKRLREEQQKHDQEILRKTAEGINEANKNTSKK